MPTPSTDPDTDLLIPTDFGAFVLNALARSRAQAQSPSQPLDQHLIRQCLALASSFLVTDVTMNPDGGLKSWSVGFNRLVDLIVVLHTTNQLEIETISTASKACSECWTAAGSWRGFDHGKEGVRAVAGKLKQLLDANGCTYKG